MPKKGLIQNHYIGTLTFAPHLTLERKLKKIQQFPSMFKDFLCRNKFYDNVHELAYSIEYHKVGTEDDPEAPHVHFIYTTTSYLAKFRFNAITAFFREEYGRSQFFLATKLKMVQWKQYMIKDVEKNNLLRINNIEHYNNIDLKTIDGSVKHVCNKTCYETCISSDDE